MTLGRGLRTEQKNPAGVGFPSSVIHYGVFELVCFIGERVSIRLTLKPPRKMRRAVYCKTCRVYAFFISTGCSTDVNKGEVDLLGSSTLLSWELMMKKEYK